MSPSKYGVFERLCFCISNMTLTICLNYMCVLNLEFSNVFSKIHKYLLENSIHVLCFSLFIRRVSRAVLRACRITLQSTLKCFLLNELFVTNVGRPALCFSAVFSRGSRTVKRACQITLQSTLKIVFY